jgi:hypothetical protein
MNEYTQSLRGDVDGPVRHYEYADRDLLVADFGPIEGSVDVVDGTAIVVIGDEQHEFEVPTSGATAFMNNGVVTIEVE